MGNEVGIIGSFVTAVIAISVGGWFSWICSKRNYSSKRSFLYGGVGGVVISSITIIAATVLGISKITDYGSGNLIKGVFIILICGLVLGFYCWSQAEKEGR